MNCTCRQEIRMPRWMDELSITKWSMPRDRYRYTRETRKTTRTTRTTTRTVGTQQPQRTQRRRGTQRPQGAQRPPRTLGVVQWRVLAAWYEARINCDL